MHQLSIDRSACAHCGQCLLSCPVHLFYRESPDAATQIVPEASETCIGCQHCIIGCPACAVSLDGESGKACLPVQKELIPRFDHIATLIRMRRSIRHFAKTPLTEQVLAQLMDVTRWAPTARNLLPVKWVVVSGSEKVRTIAEAMIDWLRSQNGTESIIKVWETGEDPVLRGAPCLVAAYTEKDAMWPEIDCTIATTMLDLTAVAMRLVTCWAGYFVRAAQYEPKINAMLGLTETQKVQAALMIGYPSVEQYQKIPNRPELDIKWIK